MVRDLLRGFAARDWSGELDLDSLTPLPASYVSHDLRQRHGDLVWRLRFKDDRWLYVVRAMLAETVQEWTAEWVEQGREQGQRELLCHMAARKFDAAAAERLAAALEGVEDADRLAQVGDWIIECETADDLFARFEGWSQS